MHNRERVLRAFIGCARNLSNETVASGVPGAAWRNHMAAAVALPPTSIG